MTTPPRRPTLHATQPVTRKKYKGPDSARRDTRDQTTRNTPIARPQQVQTRAPVSSAAPLASEHASSENPTGLPAAAAINLPPDSLALALCLAAQSVVQVGQGTALPDALRQTGAGRHMPPELRGAVQDIAYRVMRQYGLASALLDLLCEHRPKSELTTCLLLSALTLLSEDNPAYQTWTVVDQTVRATEAMPHTASAKALVNAVLRRFDRERDTLLPAARKTPAGRWNYPAWWIDRLRASYPEQWEHIVAVGQTPPPLTLRVNLRQQSTADYLLRLQQEGMEATQIGPQALRLKQPVPVLQIPGFADGAVSVQDAAAQLAAPMLPCQSGQRVLDACAAPGGKSGHLLELYDISLTALDHDAERLDKVRDNLDRLKLSANIICGDAAGTGWWDGVPFNAILADVPCTASGIVRRHPDIRWLRRKTDTEQLTTLAANILDNLWAMLAPGGYLLLATCSIWPAESELQARHFASRHGVSIQPGSAQLLPNNQENNEHDGLFYALLQKP